jgi:hypothetical protein
MGRAVTWWAVSMESFFFFSSFSLLFLFQFLFFVFSFIFLFSPLFCFFLLSSVFFSLSAFAVAWQQWRGDGVAVRW